jgi:hypothetical protein
MPPPILDYSRSPRPNQGCATLIALMMFLLGLLLLIEGQQTLIWPGHHTAADMEGIVHNAWVLVLLAAVLMIPAGCLAVGFFRDSGPQEPPEDE